MAKRLNIDDAVRWLHHEKLKFELVWKQETLECNLMVSDGSEFVGALWIYEGHVENGDAEMEGLLDFVHEQRAARAAKPELELV